MLSKINYDLLEQDNTVVNSFRNQECYAELFKTNTLESLINKKVRFYIPEFLFYPKLLMLSNGQGKYVNDIHKGYSLRYTEEQIKVFPAWLNEFGINVEFLDKEEIPRGVRDGMYPYADDAPTTIPCYSYVIDLQNCRSLAEIKFALFFPRYICHERSGHVLKLVFEIADRYPELSRWDCMMLGEFITTRLLQPDTCEYYMFARSMRIFRYFTLEQLREDLAKHAGIDPFYCTTKYFHHWELYGTEDKVLREKLASQFKETGDHLAIFEYWKNYDYATALAERKRIEREQKLAEEKVLYTIG